MTSKISKEEWDNWLSHPATEIYFAWVKEEREDAFRALSAGVFSEEQGKQNIIVGQIGAFMKILDRAFIGE